MFQANLAHWTLRGCGLAGAVVAVLAAGAPLVAQQPAPLTQITPKHVGRLTASGLVFVGSGDGLFNAVDAQTGTRPWQYRTGSAIHGAGPITYMLDGRQYVLTPSGTAIIAFALPAS